MSRRKDTGDGREEKEEEKREGAEGGEKYLYVGGSECWPLAPNQEGQGPVPSEMTRYRAVFCRIESGPCRYLPIAEIFFLTIANWYVYGAKWPFFNQREFVHIKKNIYRI